MHFCLQRGRLKLELRVQHLGRDLQVILSGGAAHLGAVALAAPGPRPLKQLYLFCPAIGRTNWPDAWPGVWPTF